MNELLRGKVLKCILGECNQIVVASSGRAGSTLLYKALIYSLFKNKLRIPQRFAGKKLERLVAVFINSLDEVSTTNRIILKTHDLLENEIGKDLKALFVYSDPLESAYSVDKILEQYGEEWFYQHQNHLRGKGRREDIFQEDVLNFQAQLESWMTRKYDNILCVDYDDLWQETNRISEFVGYEVTLPQRLSRSAKDMTKEVNLELFDELRRLKEYHKNNYAKMVSK